MPRCRRMMSAAEPSVGLLNPTSPTKSFELDNYLSTQLSWEAWNHKEPSFSALVRPKKFAFTTLPAEKKIQLQSVFGRTACKGPNLQVCRHGVSDNTSCHGSHQRESVGSCNVNLALVLLKFFIFSQSQVQELVWTLHLLSKLCFVRQRCSPREKSPDPCWIHSCADIFYCMGHTERVLFSDAG